MKVESKIDVNALVRSIEAGNAQAVAKTLPEAARSDFSKFAGISDKSFEAITKSTGGMRGVNRFGSAASAFKPVDKVGLANAAISALMRGGHKEEAVKIFHSIFKQVADAEIPKRGFQA